MMIRLIQGMISGRIFSILDLLDLFSYILLYDDSQIFDSFDRLLILTAISSTIYFKVMSTYVDLVYEDLLIEIMIISLVYFDRLLNDYGENGLQQLLKQDNIRMTLQEGFISPENAFIALICPSRSSCCERGRSNYSFLSPVSYSSRVSPVCSSSRPRSYSSRVSPVSYSSRVSISSNHQINPINVRRYYSGGIDNNMGKIYKNITSYNSNGLTFFKRKMKDLYNIFFKERMNTKRIKDMPTCSLLNKYMMGLNSKLLQSFSQSPILTSFHPSIYPASAYYLASTAVSISKDLFVVRKPLPILDVLRGENRERSILDSITSEKKRSPYIGNGRLLYHLYGNSIGGGCLFLTTMFNKQDIILYCKNMLLTLYMDDIIKNAYGYCREYEFLNSVKSTVETLDIILPKIGVSFGYEIWLSIFPFFLSSSDPTNNIMVGIITPEFNDLIKYIILEWSLRDCDILSQLKNIVENADIFYNVMVDPDGDDVNLEEYISENRTFFNQSIYAVVVSTLTVSILAGFSILLGVNLDNVIEPFEFHLPPP